MRCSGPPPKESATRPGVPAAFSDLVFSLSVGKIQIHNLGINVGDTNCSSPNFQGTGTYTISDKGNGNFEANGTFTSQFVGRPAACAGTQLTNVSFTALGRVGDNTITIFINHLASGTYAEAQSAGPLTCQAPILDLTANGSGKKFQ
jgi:hypothetical protein